MDLSVLIDYFIKLVLGSSFVGLLVYALAVFIINKAGDD